MKKLFCPKCKKDKPSNGDFFQRKDLDLASKKGHNQAICTQCIEKPQKVAKNQTKPL
jgi:hypothetical protein